MGYTSKIWKGDETISFQQKQVKVCARNGHKNLPDRVANSRASVTTMAYINAAGTAIPAMLIVKG